MAAYNGAPYIRAQLESILASPLVGEVLVSDDGSTDGTPAVVQSLDDARVRLLQGPRAGLVRNVEFLLREARGEHIFLSDQDDVWLPGKVEVLLGCLRQADLVVSDCIVVNQTLQPVQPSFFLLRRSGPGLWRNLMRNSYLGCCIALRRQLLERALPFPRHIPMHDWWLGLVAEAFGRTAFVAQPLLLYRRHGSNVSSTAEPSRATRWRQLRWRVEIGLALLARRFHLRRPRRNHPEDP